MLMIFGQVARNFCGMSGEVAEVLKNTQRMRGVYFACCIPHFLSAILCKFCSAFCYTLFLRVFLFEHLLHLIILFCCCDVMFFHSVFNLFCAIRRVAFHSLSVFFLSFCIKYEKNLQIVTFPIWMGKLMGILLRHQIFFLQLQHIFCDHFLIHRSLMSI